MECFIVRARLRTPFALTGGYLTLDSILAARVFDMTGDLQAAHEGLPLRATNGLYHASAALAEASAPVKLTVVAGLRAAHDLTADMLMKNKLGKVHSQIGLKRRRQFGNVTSQFRIVPTESVAWYGEGEAAAVQALLAGIHAIGARRQSGWGEVVEWQMEPAELDGLLGYADEPLRPIPEDLYRGDRSLPRIDAAWRPAYWNPRNRAACYAPPEPGVLAA